VIGAQIARRYAKALLELGSEQGNLDALVREIGALSDAVEGSPDLQAVIANPQVSRQARKAVLLEIAQRIGVSPTTRNTLGLLADNNRLRILPALAAALREEAERSAGVLRATITSAAPLGDAYVQRLVTALETRFKKKVVATRQIDPTLLAGVVTRVGDLVIDGSLKARLTELKSQLLPS
jgi:F-type H+-transporting ATPase subunit delta